MEERKNPSHPAMPQPPFESSPDIAGDVPRRNGTAAQQPYWMAADRKSFRSTDLPVLAGQRPSPGVGCHRSSRYPVNPGMSANSLPHCEPARVRPWRVLRSGFHTFRCVFLFAPSAPAVQVFISTMRAFDRSQLIIEIRQRFAARCCSRNRDDSPARSVLTQPSYVDLARHHLLRRPDIDVAQRR